ncbi:hypothetical protein ACJ41O_004258 [Fusarium nematophilum]
MVVYSFHIFDRHTECIYSKSWLPPHTGATPDAPAAAAAPSTSSDDAKLLFGTVFSLRNMARKLGGEDDAFISYRTAQYKLHFYETPANLRFVLLTDTATLSMRNVLHQIYINLWVEYVVKNPLAPVEHRNGEGVKNELFELGLDQFIRGLIYTSPDEERKDSSSSGTKSATTGHFRPEIFVNKPKKKKTRPTPPDHSNTALRRPPL